MWICLSCILDRLQEQPARSKPYLNSQQRFLILGFCGCWIHKRWRFASGRPVLQVRPWIKICQSQSPRKKNTLAEAMEVSLPGKIPKSRLPPDGTLVRTHPPVVALGILGANWSIATSKREGLCLTIFGSLNVSLCLCLCHFLWTCFDFHPKCPGLESHLPPTAKRVHGKGRPSCKT